MAVTMEKDKTKAAAKEAAKPKTMRLAMGSTYTTPTGRVFTAGIDYPAEEPFMHQKDEFGRPYFRLSVEADQPQALALVTQPENVTLDKIDIEVPEIGKPGLDPTKTYVPEGVMSSTQPMNSPMTTKFTPHLRTRDVREEAVEELDKQAAALVEGTPTGDQAAARKKKKGAVEADGTPKLKGTLVEVKDTAIPGVQKVEATQANKDEMMERHEFIATNHVTAAEQEAKVKQEEFEQDIRLAASGDAYKIEAARQRRMRDAIKDARKAAGEDENGDNDGYAPDPTMVRQGILVHVPEEQFSDNAPRQEPVVEQIVAGEEEPAGEITVTHTPKKPAKKTVTTKEPSSPGAAGEAPQGGTITKTVPADEVPADEKDKGKPEKSVDV